MAKRKRGAKTRIDLGANDTRADVLVPEGGPARETPEVVADVPPPPEKNKGLSCPSCGCRHLPVVKTRPGWGGRIMRVRECRHCGRRLTTFERSGGAKDDGAGSAQ